MIIDSHGHYTTAPPELENSVSASSPACSTPRNASPTARLKITDDQMRASVEWARSGCRRSAARTSRSSRRAPRRWRIMSATRTPADQWARICNDLIHRVVEMFPENFVGGLPAAAVTGASLRNASPN